MIERKVDLLGRGGDAVRGRVSQISATRSQLCGLRMSAGLAVLLLT